MTEQEIQDRQQVLVRQLKQSNIITSPAIEQAFLSVPRYLFIPGYDLDEVYRPEKAIVFRQNEQGVPTSSCSAPDVMAIMLEMLDLQPGQTVMEIGAAHGYNAALIGAVDGPQGGAVTIEL
ncbi:MAG: methyltransferase, FxLD system, partial [Chloroflexi bacterium]